jgi:ribosome recycling factor
MMLKIVLFVLTFSSMATSFVIPTFKASHRPLSTMYLSDDVEEIQMDAEERMAKSIESVKQNLATIRTGRASANMLDRVVVSYYGVPTPINQMSSISVPSAQQLTISPFEKKMLGDVEKAIIESGLGLTPMNDGAVIRINIPSLTEQRRKEMMKMCKSIGEEGKVAIRNVRRDCVDAIKKLEKASSIGEDEAMDGTDAIQKETDKAVKIIDEVVAKKEKDVMTV